MSVLDLCRRLYVHGAEITPEGDGLRLSGQPVPDDLLVELKAHKPDVLATMTAQRLGTRDDGFNSPIPRRYVLPTDCLANNACTRLGPCSQFLMRRSCGVSTREEPT